MLNNPELWCHTTVFCAREKRLTLSFHTNKPQKMSPLISHRIIAKESLAGSFQDYLGFRNPLTQVAPPTPLTLRLSLPVMQEQAID